MKTAVGRPFEKGISGNPAGRPKVPKEVQAVFDAATPKAARKLAELIDHEDPMVAIKAAEIILNRSLGKPVQHQKLDVERRGFVAVLPNPMPQDEWLRTFAPKQIIEHDPAEVQEQPDPVCPGMYPKPKPIQKDE